MCTFLDHDQARSDLVHLTQNLICWYHIFTNTQDKGQWGLVLNWASDYRTAGKSKSPNPESVMHLSCMAKECPFLLTILPPVDYHCIPSRCCFFFSQSNSIYISSNGQPSAREKHIPGPTGAFLRFSSPSSLSRCWGSQLGLELRCELIAQLPTPLQHTSGLTTHHL